MKTLYESILNKSDLDTLERNTDVALHIDNVLIPYLDTVMKERWMRSYTRCERVELDGIKFYGHPNPYDIYADQEFIDLLYNHGVRKIYCPWRFFAYQVNEIKDMTIEAAGNVAFGSFKGGHGIKLSNCKISTYHDMEFNRDMNISNCEITAHRFIVSVAKDNMISLRNTKIHAERFNYIIGGPKDSKRLQDAFKFDMIYSGPSLPHDYQANYPDPLEVMGFKERDFEGLQRFLVHDRNWKKNWNLVVWRGEYCKYHPYDSKNNRYANWECADITEDRLRL